VKISPVNAGVWPSTTAALTDKSIEDVDEIWKKLLGIGFSDKLIFVVAATLIFLPDLPGPERMTPDWALTDRLKLAVLMTDMVSFDNAETLQTAISRTSVSREKTSPDVAETGLLPLFKVLSEIERITPLDPETTLFP